METLTSDRIAPSLRDVFALDDRELSRQSREEIDQRIAELRNRLALEGDDPDAILQLSSLLDTEAGLSLLHEKARLSSSPQLLYRHIDALEDANRPAEAAEVATEGLRRWPGDPTLQIAQSLLVPIVYETQAEVLRWRNRYADGLSLLASGFRRSLPHNSEAIFQAIRGHVNFFLAAQGLNDRELQREYGELVQEVIGAVHPESVAPLEAPRVRRGERLRVGYISAHFREHSVTKSHGAWILGHDPKEFEIFAYQIRKQPNWTADALRKASDHFTVLSGDFASMFAEIRADRLHAVVFLDVGMVPQMSLLSSARLAPVQCATWGHPVTTGSPMVDYYFSSELMEPTDGEEHYTEQVVRLPSIGVCYRKPLLPRALIDSDRERFGLRRDATVYLCCQSIWKYLPARDSIFVNIAKLVPSAQFLFITPRPGPGETFRRRIGAAFRAAGMDPERYCVYLPSLNRIDYFAINFAADVFLDSVDWSGFNTTMEAVACGLPVVTMPAGSMRGRHGYAILTQLDVSETIAVTEEEYVRIAVNLGTDRKWRETIVRKMAEGEAQLFSDVSSIRGVEAWISRSVRRVC